MKSKAARPFPRKHYHVFILIATLLIAAAMIAVGRVPSSCAPRSSGCASGLGLCHRCWLGRPTRPVERGPGSRYRACLLWRWVSGFDGGGNVWED